MIEAMDGASEWIHGIGMADVWAKQDADEGISLTYVGRTLKCYEYNL